jgi:type I restriction enzyme S subunit
MSEAIPADWKQIPLEEFTTLQRGHDLTKTQFRPGQVPVAGSNGIIGYHDTALAKAPGITVGRSGSVGKITIYKEDFWPHNTSLYVRDFHGNDPIFAGYLLKSLDLARFKTGASVPTLDRNSFKSLPVVIPPLREQQTIAETLSTVERAIEAQERIIQTTTELKQALMQKLFSEGVRGEPQKMTEIGLVPESWEVARLESVAKSFQYGTSVKCDYDVQGKPDLRIPNIIGGTIKISDLKFGNPKPNENKNLRLQPGDLLFVRTNGVKENAGRCSLFEGEIEDCYFASYLIRVRLDTYRLNPSFLNEYSRIEIGTSFLSGRAIRTADGKFNINTGTLKTMLVPVPAIEEQEEIARVLALIDSKLTKARTRQSELQELLRALLHELMTAKTRIHSTVFKV